MQEEEEDDNSFLVRSDPIENVGNVARDRRANDSNMLSGVSETEGDAIDGEIVNRLEVFNI